MCDEELDEQAGEGHVGAVLSSPRSWDYRITVDWNLPRATTGSAAAGSDGDGRMRPIPAIAFIFG